MHFLPVNYRIKFKTCLLAFKIFNRVALIYFIESVADFRSTTTMELRQERDRNEFMFQIQISKRDTNYVLGNKMESNSLSLICEIR